MISGKLVLAIIAIALAPSIASAQNANQKGNKSLEQLRDVNRTSTEAAGTSNPERAKAKSNQNIDTRTPPAVRAAPPSNLSKAERDAAAIRAYTSKPPTGQDQLQRIQRQKTEVPSPGAPRVATPARPATPQPAKPVVNPAPARVTAPASPAPARAAPAAPRPAPVAAAPRPAPVAPKPAPAAAAPRPAPVATAPVRASTSTVTTSPSSSSSSTSSSSSSSPKRR